MTQRNDRAHWLDILEYGGLATLMLMAWWRQFRQGASMAGLIAIAMFAAAAAALASNNQFGLLSNNAFVGRGPLLALALWLAASAPMLWATRHYAAADKHAPWMSTLLIRAGWALVALAVAALFLPPQYLSQQQMALPGVLAAVTVAGVFALAQDQRQWRWPAILICVGLLAALTALALAMNALLPMTLIVRRGYQLIWMLLLALYLILPWLRQALQERAKVKRAAPVELSTEEKIALARDKLLDSLQSGLQSAAEGDLEWIAYRRLLEGLKSVLPQLASAVVAMN
jgi:hypothetical protein